MRGKTLTLALLILLAACDAKKKSAQAVPLPSTQLTAVGLPANIWATRIYRGDTSGCTVYYDFRHLGAYDYHVLCLAEDHRTIQLESYAYKLALHGTTYDAELIKSTCPGASQTYQFTVSGTEKQLAIKSGGEYIYLGSQPDDVFDQDLKTATMLHQRPIVRGCFSTDLKTFTPTEKQS